MNQFTSTSCVLLVFTSFDVFVLIKEFERDIIQELDDTVIPTDEELFWVRVVFTIFAALMTVIGAFCCCWRKEKEQPPRKKPPKKKPPSL